MTNYIVAGAAAGVSAVLVLTVGLGSWYTVDQGYRGVILRNGAVVGTAAPGLGFKLPLVDSVEDISVQEQVRSYGGEKGLSSYSQDQQPADIKVSVNYSIPPGRVTDVYAAFGGEDGLVTRVLDPRVYQSVKNVFGRFNAVSAIQDRARLNLEVLEALRTSIGDAPLILSGVQIENIDFSDAYEQSIEQRMQAEVEVQKLQQNAAREKVQAQITVTKANAEADAVRARAQADGDAIRIKGEAEASAIRARAQALGVNPSLIALTQAERWNGALPTTMIPGSTIPFINTTEKVN